MPIPVIDETSSGLVNPITPPPTQRQAIEFASLLDRVETNTGINTAIPLTNSSPLVANTSPYQREEGNRFPNQSPLVKYGRPIIPERAIGDLPPIGLDSSAYEGLGTGLSGDTSPSFIAPPETNKTPYRPYGEGDNWNYFGIAIEDTLNSMIGGGAGLASLFGADELSKSLSGIRDKIQKDINEARANLDYETVKDIETQWTNGDIFSNLSAVGTQLVGVAPTMIATVGASMGAGALARILLGSVLAPATAGAVGGAVGSGMSSFLQSYGANANQVINDINNTDTKALLKIDSFKKAREGYINKGHTADEADRMAREELNDSIYHDPGILSAAALVAITEMPIGAWIGKLSGAKAVGEVVESRGKAAITGVLAEGAQEAVQNPTEQVAQNVLAQKTYDPNRKTFEGFTESLVQGAVLGGLSGGLIGGALGGEGRAAQSPGANQPPRSPTVPPDIAAAAAASGEKETPPEGGPPSGPTGGGGYRARPLPDWALNNPAATRALLRGEETPYNQQAPVPPTAPAQGELPLEGGYAAPRQMTIGEQPIAPRGGQQLELPVTTNEPVEQQDPEFLARQGQLDFYGGQQRAQQPPVTPSKEFYLRGDNLPLPLEEPAGIREPRQAQLPFVQKAPIPEAQKGEQLNLFNKDTEGGMKGPVQRFVPKAETVTTPEPKPVIERLHERIVDKAQKEVDNINKDLDALLNESANVSKEIATLEQKPLNQARNLQLVKLRGKRTNLKGRITAKRKSLEVAERALDRATKVAKEKAELVARKAARKPITLTKQELVQETPPVKKEAPAKEQPVKAEEKAPVQEDLFGLPSEFVAYVLGELPGAEEIVAAHDRALKNKTRTKKLKDVPPKDKSTAEYDEGIADYTAEEWKAARKERAKKYEETHKAIPVDKLAQADKKTPEFLKKRLANIVIFDKVNKVVGDLMLIARLQRDEKAYNMLKQLKEDLYAIKNINRDPKQVISLIGGLLDALDYAASLKPGFAKARDMLGNIIKEQFKTVAPEDRTVTKKELAIAGKEGKLPNLLQLFGRLAQDIELVREGYVEEALKKDKEHADMEIPTLKELVEKGREELLSMIDAINDRYGEKLISKGGFGVKGTASIATLAGRIQTVLKAQKDARIAGLKEIEENVRKGIIPGEELVTPIGRAIQGEQWRRKKKVNRIYRPGIKDVILQKEKEILTEQFREERAYEEQEQAKRLEAAGLARAKISIKKELNARAERLVRDIKKIIARAAAKDKYAKVGFKSMHELRAMRKLAQELALVQNIDRREFDLIDLENQFDLWLKEVHKRLGLPEPEPIDRSKGNRIIRVEKVVNKNPVKKPTKGDMIKKLVAANKEKLASSKIDKRLEKAKAKVNKTIGEITTASVAIAKQLAAIKTTLKDRELVALADKFLTQLRDEKTEESIRQAKAFLDSLNKNKFRKAEVEAGRMRSPLIDRFVQEYLLNHKGPINSQALIDYIARAYNERGGPTDEPITDLANILNNAIRAINFGIVIRLNPNLPYGTIARYGGAANGQDVIEINHNSADFGADIVLHEMLHAMTSHLLDTDEYFNDDIQALLNIAARHPSANIAANMFTDVHEFLAYGLSDKESINLLKRIVVDEVSGVKLNGFQKFINAIVNAISRVLKRAFNLPFSDTFTQRRTLYKSLLASLERNVLKASTNPYERGRIEKEALREEGRNAVSDAFKIAAEQVPSRAKFMASEGTDFFNRHKLGFMSLSQMTDAYWGLFGGSSRTSNPFLQLSYLKNSLSATMNALLNSSNSLARRFSSYKAENPDGMMKLNHLMAYSRLYEMHPDMAFTPGVENTPNGHLIPELENKWKELNSVYNSLDKEGKEIFHAVRAHGEKQFKESMQALRTNILMAFDVPFEQAEKFAAEYTPDKAEQMFDAVTRLTKDKKYLVNFTPEEKEFIKDLFFKSKQMNGPYFPFRRKGKHLVVSRYVIDELQAEDTKKLKEKLAVYAKLNPTHKIGKIREEGTSSKVRIYGQEVRFFEHRSTAEGYKAAQEKAFASDPKHGEGLRAEFREQLDPLGDYFADTEGNEVKGPDGKPMPAKNWAVSNVLLRENMVENLDPLPLSVTRRLEDKLRGNDTALHAFKTAVIDLLPDTSFKKSELRFKKVEGFMEAMDESFAINARANAYYQAHLLFGRRIAGSMQDIYRAMKSNEYSSGRYASMERVYNELSARDKRERYMYEENKLADFINDYAFVNFLGTLSFSLINMTQVYTHTLPYLYAKHGTKALAGMKDAWTLVAPDVFKQIAESKLGFGAWNQEGADKVFNILSHLKDQLDKSDVADKDAILTMVKALGEQGTFELTFAQALHELAEGKTSNTVTRVMDIARALPHMVEVLNRVSTAVAAYRLIKEDMPDISEQDAYDWANKVVTDTHINYSEYNKGRYLRRNISDNKIVNAISSSVFMFKQHSLNTLYLLSKNAYVWAQNSVLAEASGKEVDKEAKRFARRVVLAMIGTQLSLAGTIGVIPEPLVMALALVLMATDDEDDPTDWQVAMREGMASVFGSTGGELVSRGVIPHALGFDISGRIGWNNMLMMEADDTKHGKDYLSNMLWQSLGPAFGQVGRWGDAVNYINKGDLQKAFMLSVPRGFTDVTDAYRLGTKGLLDSNGNVIKDPGQYGPYDLILRAIGLQTAENAELQDARRAVQGREAAVQERRKNLMEQYFRASNKADVWGDVKQFNTTNPDYKITQDMLLRSAKQHKKLTNERLDDYSKVQF